MCKEDGERTSKRTRNLFTNQDQKTERKAFQILDKEGLGTDRSGGYQRFHGTRSFSTEIDNTAEIPSASVEKHTLFTKVFSEDQQLSLKIPQIPRIDLV